MKKPPKKINKRYVVLAILLAVPLIVIAFIVFNYITMQNNIRLDVEDRARFELVKADVEILTERLNAVDPDVQWETSATCQRSRVKFSEGLTGCVVQASSEVAVTNEGEAEQRIKAYSEVFSQSSDFFRQQREYSANDYSPDFPKGLDPGFGGQTFWSDRADMVCGSLFKIEDTYGAPPSDKLEMRFACNDDARDTWFARSDR